MHDFTHISQAYPLPKALTIGGVTGYAEAQAYPDVK